MNETNGRPPSMTKGMRDLAHDVITLTELQGQLLLTDLRDGKARLVKAGILLGAAPVIVVAVLPVFVLGLSSWLASLVGWRESVMQMSIAGGLLLLAAGLGWLGWLRLCRAFNTLARSRQEFKQNIRWFKSVLRPTPRGQTPAPREAASRSATQTSTTTSSFRG